MDENICTSMDSPIFLKHGCEELQDKTPIGFIVVSYPIMIEITKLNQTMKLITRHEKYRLNILQDDEWICETERAFGFLRITDSENNIVNISSVFPDLKSFKKEFICIGGKVTKSINPEWETNIENIKYGTFLIYKFNEENVYSYQKFVSPVPTNNVTETDTSGR